MKVAVIGGGPIGLYTGISLAQLGYDVSLFEKKIWPVDKVCGQGIMSSGVEKLNEINLELQEAFSFSGITYKDGKQTCQSFFDHYGLGVERSVLSKSLYEKAKTISNLKLYPETTVSVDKNVEDHVELLVQEKAQGFDYVFACDGLHSKTRDDLGQTLTRTKNLRMGARGHFHISPWSDQVEVYWAHGIEAYVTPVSAQKIEIAFLWYQKSLTQSSQLWKDLIKNFPELEKKVGLDKPLDFKGYGPFSKYSKSIKKNRVFFVGDAYCFVDGITGEGISLGLNASSYITHNFRDWGFLKAFKIKTLYFHYSFFVHLALFFSKRRGLRRYLFKYFLRHPRVFNTLVHLSDKKPLV